MTVAVLPGAYGSFAPGAGVAFYGSAGALRAFAEALRRGGPSNLKLEAPPDKVEEGPVQAVRIQMVPGETSVAVWRDQATLEVVGGETAIRKLAEALENLAVNPRGVNDPVRPHLDLEYFPGHDFLDEHSMWMTVALIAGPV